MNTALSVPETIEFLRETADEIALTAKRAIRLELAAGIRIPGERYDFLVDCERHLGYLIEALNTRRPAIIERYLEWNLSVIEAVGIPASDLMRVFESLRDVIKSKLGDALSEPVSELINHGLGKLRERDGDASPIKVRPLKPLAAKYLALLLDGKRRDAAALILEEVQRNTSLRDLYLNVFQPVQREVGQLWQTNAIGVAEEHFCTAATQLIISQVYPYMTRAPKRGRSIVTVSAAGNLHELGTRMVADFFEMDGWDTYFIGSSTPAGEIVKSLLQRSADVLALSLSMATQLPEARRVLAAIRAEQKLAGTIVLAGGYAFANEPDLWREIGADGYAIDAEAAVTTANQLIDARHTL